LKYAPIYGVRTLARALDISRQRVYFILKNPVRVKYRKVKKMNDEEVVLKQIEEIVRELPVYGYRRVVAVLRARYGVPFNRKKVYRLMKQKGLLMPPSHSHKKLFKGVAFAHNVKAETSNTLWGIDMTYIWCGVDAWCYFHGVIDHHDKNLLGYNFSRSCGAIGGVMALANAAAERRVENLELRSDNGCHYGAKVFKDEIKRLGIKHTRTMVNTPKGNSVIERFFRSLKEECVWQQKFYNFEEAEKAVSAWVNHYNTQRPHQALAYETPNDYYRRSIQKNVEKVS
jgi:putative transposase